MLCTRDKVTPIRGVAAEDWKGASDELKIKMSSLTFRLICQLTSTHEQAKLYDNDLAVYTCLVQMSLFVFSDRNVNGKENWDRSTDRPVIRQENINPTHATAIKATLTCFDKLLLTFLELFYVFPWAWDVPLYRDFMKTLLHQAIKQDGQTTKLTCKISFSWSNFCTLIFWLHHIEFNTRFKMLFTVFKCLYEFLRYW